MITAETTNSLVGDYEESKDPNFMVKEIGKFTASEPHFVAYLTVTLVNLSSMQNPITAAMIAVTLYEKMRISQENADKLGKEIG